MKIYHFPLFRVAASAFVGALLGFPAASAQSPAPHNSLSPNPLLAAPPSYSRWIITKEVFSLSNSPKKTTQTITRTGEILSQKTESDGQVTEMYRIGLIDYISENGAAVGTFPDAGSLPIEDGTFPEFAWVAPRFLIGTMLVRNQLCWVYADVLGKSAPSNGEPDQKLASLFPSSDLRNSNPKQLPGIIPPAILADGVRIACISKDSNLPFLLQNGMEVRSYTFTSLPKQSQPLPKAVQEMKDPVERVNKALYAPFARP